MAKKYLVLGASSDLAAAFFRILDRENEEIIIYAQYRTAINTDYEKFKFHPFKVDLENKENIKAFVAEIQNICFDGIFHFAAPALEFMKMKKWNQDRIEANMQISVYSFGQIAGSLLPVMAKNKKGIVFAALSSVLEETPKFMVDYVMAKSALKGLMQAMEAEYAEKGIRFVSISPSMMETKFLKSIDPKIIEMDAAASPGGVHVTTGQVAQEIFRLINSCENI